LLFKKILAFVAVALKRIVPEPIPFERTRTEEIKILRVINGDISYPT
jgi:hypothetical protein